MSTRTEGFRILLSISERARLPDSVPILQTLLLARLLSFLKLKGFLATTMFRLHDGDGQFAQYIVLLKIP